MPMPKKPRSKCLHCEKECKRPIAKYCSNKCQIAYQREIKVSEQRACHRALRNYLMQKDPACARCRIKEWLCHYVALELDHIDGDSSNNELSNVRLLCPNCHSQTDTYKAKNRGNGRHSRRQRYADGKSY